MKDSLKVGPPWKQTETGSCKQSVTFHEQLAAFLERESFRKNLDSSASFVKYEHSKAASMLQRRLQGRSDFCEDTARVSNDFAVISQRVPLYRRE